MSQWHDTDTDDQQDEARPKMFARLVRRATFTALATMAVVVAMLCVSLALDEQKWDRVSVTETR